jgi:hypothetical protein
MRNADCGMRNRKSRGLVRNPQFAKGLDLTQMSVTDAPMVRESAGRAERLCVHYGAAELRH